MGGVPLRVESEARRVVVARLRLIMKQDTRDAHTLSEPRGRPRAEDLSFDRMPVQASK
jgi:hypothetical protein